MYRRMGGVLKKKLRLAAEQPWMVTLGASPGNLAGEPGKLRSSDVDSIAASCRCSAAQTFCLPMTCGFTAGYLTSLLRSESEVLSMNRSVSAAVSGVTVTISTLVSSSQPAMRPVRGNRSSDHENAAG